MDVFVDGGMDYVNGQYVEPKTLAEAITKMRKIKCELADVGIAACLRPDIIPELLAQQSIAFEYIEQHLVGKTQDEIMQATLEALNTRYQ